MFLQASSILLCLANDCAGSVAALLSGRLQQPILLNEPGILQETRMIPVPSQDAISSSGRVTAISETRELIRTDEFSFR